MKNAEKKRPGSRKSKILLVVIILLIGALGFSVYQVLSVYIPQQREQQHFAELRDQIDEDEYEYVVDTSATPDSPDVPVPTEKILTHSKYDKLFERYEDMCGWLRIAGTAVDYPVMMSDREEGEYYLHRDVDGDYSFAGCLFVGVNCHPDSDAFIIYGHNMKNGSMFACLTDFADTDFVMSHRDICFDTKNERRVYRIFASFASYTYSKEDKAFKYYDSVGDMDQATYDDVLAHYRSMSQVWIDDLPGYPAQIMLLSTCYTEKERFVVAAYRVK